MYEQPKFELSLVKIDTYLTLLLTPYDTCYDTCYMTGHEQPSHLHHTPILMPC